MTIAYNNETNQFEYTVDGVVKAKSANLSYLKQKVKNMGLPSAVPAIAGEYAPQQTAVPVVPKEKFTVDERFNFIERFVKGVAKGNYLSLVLVGSGGLGKTYTVLNTLREMGKKEILPIEVPPAKQGQTTPEELEKLMAMPTQTSGDFIVIKGFSTSKALYRTLYENNGKIIIFDDADAAFKSMDSANLLKAALDNSEPRYLSWGSERHYEDDLPARFRFTGQVIFVSNLDLQDFPQAILSRAMHVDLTLTTAEKVERIETILGKLEDQRGVADVLDIVREYGARFHDLNVRTAMLMLSIRRAEPDDEIFRRMSLYHAVG
jgi:hypothetical protein